MAAPKKKKMAKPDVPSMFINLNSVMEQVGRDRGIPKEVLIEAIESAMLIAAKRRYGSYTELEAHYNEDLGEVELFQFKEVVEEVEDPDIQISLEEARVLDSEATVGDSLGEKIDSHQFGRIAAQAAKQVIIQKLREAERDLIVEEYKDRVGDILTGIVRRVEKGNLILDLGRTEALVPVKEQVPTESYKVGDRLQAYFTGMQKDTKGPPLLLSRRHPNFVKALFAMEVPEISDGIVEIKAVAREPGSRSKIAVYSSDSDVDPIGACVGLKGSRVQNVVQELKGEKVDIISYEEEPARFVCNSVAPAEVNKVIIHENDLVMEVIVPDDQLSLAIGKKGQNVRLAAELTGWDINILSETRFEELQKQLKARLSEDLNIEDSLANLLYSHGFRSARDFTRFSREEVFHALSGLDPELLEQIYDRASEATRKHNQKKKALATSAAVSPEKTEGEQQVAQKPPPQKEVVGEA